MIFISHKLHEVLASPTASRCCGAAARSIGTVPRRDDPQSLARSWSAGRSRPARRQTAAAIGDVVLDVAGLSALGDRGVSALDDVSLVVRGRRDPRRRRRGRQRPARARRGDHGAAPCAGRIDHRRGRAADARRPAVGDPRRASPTCPRIGCIPASRPSLSVASQLRAQGLSLAAVLPRAVPATAAGSANARRHIQRYDIKTPGPDTLRVGSPAATCRRSSSPASSRASRACSLPRRRPVGSTSARSRPCTSTCARPRPAVSACC